MVSFKFLIFAFRLFQRRVFCINYVPIICIFLVLLLWWFWLVIMLNMMIPFPMKNSTLSCKIQSSLVPTDQLPSSAACEMGSKSEPLTQIGARLRKWQHLAHVSHCVFYLIHSSQALTGPLFNFSGKRTESITGVALYRQAGAGQAGWHFLSTLIWQTECMKPT